MRVMQSRDYIGSTAIKIKFDLQGLVPIKKVPNYVEIRPVVSETKHAGRHIRLSG